MELADLTNPVPKGSLDDGDRIFVFDGEDVCLVPAAKAHQYMNVVDVLGGFVVADEANDVGKISIEDYVVASVGLQYAEKFNSFQNAFSDKMDLDSIRLKLKDLHYIPTDCTFDIDDMVLAQSKGQSAFEVELPVIVGERGINETEWVFSLYRFQKGVWDVVESIDSTKFTFNNNKFIVPFSESPDTDEEIKIGLVYNPVIIWYEGFTGEKDFIYNL